MIQEQELFRLNLIRTLQRNGWSQRHLSQKTGIAESEISRIINANIPLTVDRLATICCATDIETNEFYRNDIVIENDHLHTKVYLKSEYPPIPAKRQRHYNYEKQKYRLTERQMKAFVHKLYTRGFNDGVKSHSGRYVLPEEEAYKVAEDIMSDYS